MALEAAETEEDFELSPEESHKFFDDMVRLHLGMSGEEFLRKYDAGYWPDPDADPDVMHLIMLRPFAE